MTPGSDLAVDPVEAAAMARALELAASVRSLTSPNPWVGCVVEPGGFEGATRPPGGLHAERIALAAAGAVARDATLVTTLEPCSHHGRTPPCVEAIVAAGVRRVVVAIEDPDPHVRGSGIRALRQAGVEVEVGVGAAEARAQLAPYLKHRRTGRPWVVLKLAATLDGRTAAPDGSSRWITGPKARADAHRLRAESDAIVVGAGTVRTDDPQLTVRLEDGDGEGRGATSAELFREVAAGEPLSGTVLDVGASGGSNEGKVASGRQPLRVVLGKAPAGAKVRPALELEGDLGEVLDELGRRGVVQALVEGGPSVAGAFHRAGLVDRYVLYLAPALLGGDDGRPVLGGEGVATMAEAWRGRIVSVERLGEDLRVDLAPVGAD